MSFINENIVRSLTEQTSVPLVFRGYVNNWPLCQWNIEKWSETFGEKEFPFRCKNRDFKSDEPCWERKCTIKKMTFKKFLKTSTSSEEWMYFDYKYLHEWFSTNDVLCKAVSWAKFGYTDKEPAETTLWVGSEGAHTPAHQDTYGVNIVTQVYGKKLWILFPPESGGMKPTRVPYEESSVYSELNFCCPVNVEEFQGLTGARIVELSAGDALIVPHGWWHYVQNEDPVNITLNMWLPHEEDKSTRVAEAAIKVFVAQITKDLPLETIKEILNPNEDDLPDTPLAVLFLQLETAAKQNISNITKKDRIKRQKTLVDTDKTDSDHTDYDLKALVENPANKMETLPIISGKELIKLIERNINRYVNGSRSPREDEVDSSSVSHCLPKIVINSFCQGNVVESFTENLLARMGLNKS